MSNTRYSVSVEICHVLSQEDADLIANVIKNRLSDVNADVYVCTSAYTQVSSKELGKPYHKDLSIEPGEGGTCVIRREE